MGGGRSRVDITDDSTEDSTDASIMAILTPARTVTRPHVFQMRSKIVTLTS